MQPVGPQQPAQLVELHAAPPVHTPAAHVCVGPHEVQVAPLTPHESGDCIDVGWQVPFEQQPAQLKKSHATVGVQAPIVHELFIGQVVHASPALPHCEAVCEPNGTHRLPWQQPFAHVSGVQVATMVQLPAVQVEPLPQGLQEAPPEPHALLF